MPVQTRRRWTPRSANCKVKRELAETKKLIGSDRVSELAVRETA
jgi:hypothetical protein